MKFLVHDAAGNILRTGYCSQGDLALQAHEGETAIEDTAGDTDDRKHRIVNGERVEFTPEPPPPPTVEAQRARDYRPVQDQLDDLWHAMDAGILPMVPEFYEPNATVEARYPKPINKEH